MANDSQEILVYVGGYTRGRDGDNGSEGLYLFKLNQSTGALEPLAAGPLVQNPSYLALSADGQYLYTVNETGEFKGQPGGGVSAFKLDPETGAPTLINQTSAIGGGTCYISLDQTGRYALVANYGTGSVAVVPVQSDGSVGQATGFAQHEGPFGPNARRQQGPHGHSFAIAPDNSTCLACDLGCDKVFLYDLDHASGKITAHKPAYLEVPAGGGPRHQVFSAAGDRLYINHELDGKLSVYAWDGKAGALMQTINTLPEDFTGDRNTTADLHFSLDGRFLYLTNRGHDSIVSYAVAQDGTLTLLGWEPTQGQHPRNFCIDPTGTFLFVANQFTNNIVSFRIDAETGKLTATGLQTVTTAPTCIKMLAR